MPTNNFQKYILRIGYHHLIIQIQNKISKISSLFYSWEEVSFSILSFPRFCFMGIILIVNFQYFLLVKSVTINKMSFSIININKITFSKNPMFYNFNYETQANFDDEDFSSLHHEKCHSLPTTSENSPGSIKSGSTNSLQLDNNFESSFEFGSQAKHAQNIWRFSTNLLDNSLNFFMDQQKGFNCDNLYRFVTLPNMGEEKVLEKVLKENKLLKSKEKNKFIHDLQQETEICGLLVELMVLFNEKVFSQLVYVIHNIWEKRYLHYRQTRKNKSSLFPQFKCFFGFEEDENACYKDTNRYDSNISEIKQASEKNCEQIARELFSSKKLKYLNLHEIKGDKRQSNIIREQFTSFIKLLSKTVFLSAEGIYDEDENDEQISIPAFSEQDQEEFDLPVMKGNRFVRSFSQIQQDDESENYTPDSTKRRKLF